jgi:hypothetical protein
VKRRDPLTCLLFDQRFPNLEAVREHVDEDHDPSGIKPEEYTSWPLIRGDPSV